MIVMGVITAIPFGLAIRQTLHKGSAGDRELEETMDPSLKYEREMEESHKAMEARYEAERIEEAQKKREISARQKDVFGTSPASLGKLFDGITLGAPADSFQPEAARARIADAREQEIHVDFELDLKSLAGVKIKIGGYRSECSEFGEELKTAWGPSLFGTADRHAWIAQNQRAVFDETHCQLTIERFADVPSWIGHGEASIVPIDYLNKPSKALLAKLGPTVDADESMIVWQQVGVGTGSGTTALTAEIENGKIAAITARTTVDASTRSDVEDRLAKLFGKATEYPESGATLGWTWGKIPVGLTTTSDKIDLRFGK